MRHRLATAGPLALNGLVASQPLYRVYGSPGPTLSHPWSVDYFELQVVIQRAIVTITAGLTMTILLGSDRIYNRSISFDTSKTAYVVNPFLERIDPIGVIMFGGVLLELDVVIDSLAGGLNPEFATIQLDAYGDYIPR